MKGFITFEILDLGPDLVADTADLSSQEAGAERSQVPVQLEVRRNRVSQKTTSEILLYRGQPKDPSKAPADLILLGGDLQGLK